MSIVYLEHTYKPASHDQFKIPPSLLQKTLGSLLQCLDIGFPTARDAHTLLVLEERGRAEADESFGQETMGHVNQGLVMHCRLQAHTPPGLLLKPGKLFRVAGPGDVWKMEARKQDRVHDIHTHLHVARERTEDTLGALHGFVLANSSGSRSCMRLRRGRNELRPYRRGTRC